jgi:hypothetical protein
MNSLKRRNVFVVGGDPQIRIMYRNRNYNLVDDIADADIVQFIGGADVNPSLYGEVKLASTSVSHQADERDLDAWDRSKGKLRVGICRGGQFLNVKSGGRMWQHVDGHGAYKGHLMKDVLFAEENETKDNTFLVTSTHHQLMAPADDGEVIGFATALAYNHKSCSMIHPSTFDPEVVWYEKTNSLCHQPHPEYSGFKDCTSHFFKLIDHFMG